MLYTVGFIIGKLQIRFDQLYQKKSYTFIVKLLYKQQFNVGRRVGSGSTVFKWTIIITHPPSLNLATDITGNVKTHNLSPPSNYPADIPHLTVMLLSI